MINCQEASELVEKSRFERIPLKKRVGLRFHAAICADCRKYFKDSDIMEEMLSSKRFRHKGNYSFSTEEKQKLKDLLEANQKD